MELRIRSNVNTIGKGLNKVLLTLRQLKKFGLEQNEWDELRNNYILLMDNEETIGWNAFRNTLFMGKHYPGTMLLT